jgi:hypothetical protein
MRIQKCNGCGKVLEDGKDEYYSISDISFHAPGHRGTRVFFAKTEQVEEKRELVESWIDYVDLDFCPECWDKEDFKKYTEPQRPNEKNQTDK